MLSDTRHSGNGTFCAPSSYHTRYSYALRKVTRRKGKNALTLS